MADTEKEDWDDLQRHAGWQRLVSYAKTQWGGLAYRAKIDQAIAKAEADKTDVASAVKAVNAVTDEVNRLLSYPHDRVRQLSQPSTADVVPLSRRGAL